MRKIERKVFISLIAAVIFLILFGQAKAFAKTIFLLNHVFSAEEVNLFEIYMPEEIVVDGKTKFYIFKPDEEKQYPALIFSSGFSPFGAKDPRLAKPVEGFIKSGFVVLLIDSEDLKNALLRESAIENLVVAFEELKKKDYVNKGKIGFIGLSVGSSFALIAASDERIRDDVLFVLWVGGYYDLEEYVIDVLSKSYVHEGRVVEWKLDPWIHELGKRNVKEFVEDETYANIILSAKDRNELESLIRQLPPEFKYLEAKQVEFKQKVAFFSPKSYIEKLRAKVFIIHDKQDILIPFTHSLKLKEDLNDLLGGMVLTEAFVHVTPAEIKIDFTLLQTFPMYSRIVLFTSEIFSLVES